MHFHTALFIAFNVFALALYIASLIANIAQQYGRRYTLWEQCWSTTCTTHNFTCTSAGDIINGSRACLIITTVMTGICVVVASIDLSCPDTLYKKLNAILGWSTILVGAVTWVVLLCLFVVSFCDGTKSFNDADYKLGGNAPCAIVAWVLTIVAVVCEIWGPRGAIEIEEDEVRLEAENERKEEMRRKQAIESAAHFQRDHDARMERAREDVAKSAAQYKRRSAAAGSGARVSVSPAPPPPTSRDTTSPSHHHRQSNLPTGPARQQQRSASSSSGFQRVPAAAAVATTAPVRPVATPRTSSPRNYDVPPSPRSRSAGGGSPRGGPASLARADDWELEPESGLLYSATNDLLYDAEENLFVDPTTSMCYDPEAPTRGWFARE